MKFPPNTKQILTGVVIVVIALLSYKVLTTSENRSMGEKLDEVVDVIQDRTPAEKVHDKIEDITGN